MKNKTKLQKLVALFSAIMLLVTSLGFQVLAEGETASASQEEMTVLGMDDFLGGATEQSWTGRETALLTAGEGTLDNVTIEGVVNIKRYSSIAIGSQAGYRLMLGVANSEHFYCQVADASGVLAEGAQRLFGPNELGRQYNGQDVPLKVSFAFENENAETGLADVTIRIKIGTFLEEQVYTITNAIMAQFARVIYVHSNTGGVTLKVTPGETVLGMEDFLGGATQQSWSGSETAVLTAGTGTLEDVTIEGVVNIRKYSSISIGSQANYRFMMGVNGSEQLYMQVANRAGVVAGGGEARAFGPAAVGYYYNGNDIPLKISFDFANQNYITNRADLTIKVKIGEFMEEQVFTIAQVATSQFEKVIFVNSNTGGVTLKVKPEETAETVLGIDDFLNGATEKTWTGAASNAELLTAGEGNLDGVTIEGLFTLRKYSVVSFGSDAGWRFRLGVGGTEHLYYDLANRNGLVTEQQKFGPADVGYYYNGGEIPVRVSFTYAKKNYVAGTADLIIKLQIGDFMEEQVIEYANFPMAGMTRSIHANPNTASLTLKKLVEEEKTVLSVKDFMQTDEQAFSGTESQTFTAGEGNLDGVVIDGIFNINRYASIAIGNAAGHRFMIGVNGASAMYYQYANNAGVVAGTSENIGTAYTGKDTRIKVEFTYTKQNFVTNRTDVVVKLNIGDSIEREIVVPQVAIVGLYRTLFVNANTGSISVKATTEYYDAATGYELVGENITVNEESVDAEALTAAGDYFVRCAGEDAYAKYVILWNQADAYVDDTVDVLDLVAIRNASKGASQITSKAGNKAADVDGNGTIEATDCAGVRNILALAQ